MICVYVLQHQVCLWAHALSCMPARSCYLFDCLGVCECRCGVGGIECFHEECKMRSSGALLLY